MKIKLAVILFTILLNGFTGLTSVRAQADQPAVMKQNCKNFLGRPMQSLCTSEEAYNACFAYLKQGKWDFCALAGNTNKRARRSTLAEARQTLLQKFCKEVSPNTFQCPDADYALSTAYLDCIAYQTGTPGINCLAPLDLLSIYANKIEARLKGYPVGYAFVVTNNQGKSIERAWGLARKEQDAPSLPMSVDSKYTLASVSKNITAAALMKVLSQKNIPVTSKILPYLPSIWKTPESFKATTFEDLLTHRSGIRCDFGDGGYESTKECVEKGVNVNQKAVDCAGKALTQKPQIGCYNNYNYALFRILIPRVNGFLDNNQPNPASNYAALYSSYVNKEIFGGIPFTAACSPTDGTKQPLSYKLSAPNGKGEVFGDKSLVCGSQGWYLSAKMLSDYFSKLNRTGDIISKNIAEQMRENLYGYTHKVESTTKYGKISRWWHGGYHPASMNAGEINTLVMRFSNGVQIAFIMNSDLPPSMNQVTILAGMMLQALNE